MERGTEAAASCKRKPQPGRTGWGPEVSAVWSQPAEEFNLRSAMSAVIVPICRSGTEARALSHSWQRTYGISTGTGFLELSVILFSPEIFTSNATSETETPSEHDAITFTSEPFSWNDLTVHF